MERVNLIPDDVALTWGDRVLAFVDRRFVQVLAVTVATAGFLLAGFAIRQDLLRKTYAKQTSRLEAKQATFLAELENIKAYLAQLDQVEQQLNQQMQWVMQRIAYLSSYRATEGEWAAILQEIKRAIPYGVWLTELESGGEGQLRITGGAFEDRLVTQFMGQLKENPRFTNVAFSFAKKANIGKQAIVAFELTCQITAATAATS